jgi:hypothetical protein
VKVIYEVNLQVAAPAADAFAEWLPGHIEDMLALPGFIDAVIALEESTNPAAAAWSVRYRLHDRMALDNYLHTHADRMRADGLARFGDHMSATRRILVETHCLQAHPRE